MGKILKAREFFNVSGISEDHWGRSYLKLSIKI